MPSMTRDHRDDSTITSQDEFEARLAGLVERAVKDGVDVRGAWTFRTRGSTHDWEVEIYELARELDDEDDPFPNLDDGDGEE